MLFQNKKYSFKFKHVKITDIFEKQISKRGKKQTEK